MRDRLIELISQVQYMGGLEGKLADHLIANGVIIPPCKVGELLFCIIKNKSVDKVYSHIEACRVNEIMCFGSGRFVFGVLEINKHYSHNFVLGKDAFKTFEEAEAKLKECGGNG